QWRRRPWRTTRSATGRRAWRRWARRWTQVFPAQEGLQVLRREDRGGQLQGCAPAGAVRRGKRQDHSAAPDRRVHAAPAASVAGDQAGEEHRFAAVRGTGTVSSKSSLVVGRSSFGNLWLSTTCAASLLRERPTTI